VSFPPASDLSLTLQDRNGLPLRTTRAGDGSRTTWLSLDEMDPQLIQAFVALEDRRFYGHHGIDPRAVARALVQDLRHGRVVSGASTITMQLARLLHPAGHGIGAKLSQSLWALRLEAHLTKQQILEQYLNRVPLGQGAVGVAAAASLYFNASAGELSLGQVALLAGLASAPLVDNPWSSADRARARRSVALSRMVALGFADREAASRAATEPLTAGHGQSSFLAPHFTSAVLQWLGDSVQPTPDSRLPTPDARRTSLDLSLQTELESEVRHTVSLLHDEEVAEAAAVVLDNATGEILAWVGSPDFWADSAGQVDMVVSPRQPGSALKPFLYALAFDRGYTAASILPDIPRTYRTSMGPYQPRNYDRHFHGPVRARDALASSFNVPAVELTDRLGAGGLLRVLHDAGFRSLTGGADQYGLGLALGNGDVTLLEMANGYRALANGGVWRPVRWEADGRSDGRTDGPHFVSRGAALLVLDVLSDPVARIPGFGPDTPFDFPFPVAVKTGTSHHFTDNWAVGVTAGFTVAVWVGNFTGRPMRRISGVTGAGPLLHRAVMAVARRYQPGALPSPAEAGAVRVKVCRLSGLRAGADCPGTDEWFLPGTEPEGDCDWHAGGGVHWPAAYASWAAKDGRTDGQTDGHSEADRQSVSPSVRLAILSPQDGDHYEIPPGVDRRYATIALSAAATADDQPVRWLVDGSAISGSRWPLQSGTHRIRAVGASGRMAEVRVQVR